MWSLQTMCELYAGGVNCLGVSPGESLQTMWVVGTADGESERHLEGQNQLLEELGGRRAEGTLPPEFGSGLAVGAEPWGRPGCCSICVKHVQHACTCTCMCIHLPMASHLPGCNPITGERLVSSCHMSTHSCADASYSAACSTDSFACSRWKSTPRKPRLRAR